MTKTTYLLAFDPPTRVTESVEREALVKFGGNMLEAVITSIKTDPQHISYDSLREINERYWVVPELTALLRGSKTRCKARPNILVLIELEEIDGSVMLHSTVGVQWGLFKYLTLLVTGGGGICPWNFGRLTTQKN